MECRAKVHACSMSAFVTAACVFRLTGGNCNQLGNSISEVHPVEAPGSSYRKSQ
jgi:hypothetical protein